MSVIVIAKPTDQPSPPFISAVCDTREEAEDHVESTVFKQGARGEFHLVDAVELTVAVELSELEL